MKGLFLCRNFKPFVDFNIFHEREIHASGSNPDGFLLRSQGQPGCQKAMVLRHGGFSAVYHIVDELFSVGHVNLGAIEVPGLLLVDQEKVVPALFAGNVDVFPHLNVPIGAQNEGSAITPGTQAIGSKPVDPDIARSLGTPHDHIAKVLVYGVLSCTKIANLRKRHLSLCGPCVKQELVALV